MQKTNPIRCLIIDDEPIARRIVKSHLAKVEGFVVTGESSHALEGFSFLQKTPIDLLFLDIQMPKLNGLDFLRSLNHKPKVIIISAHREYALEGFELDVVDYLLKPVSFERFLKALDKFRQRQSTVTPVQAESLSDAVSHLFIRADRKTIRLDLSEVLYIESMSDYLKIHTKENVILTKEKISKIEEELPSQFLRIHRSFIINTKHLEAFTPEIAEVAGKELPISRSLRQQVMELLKP